MNEPSANQPATPAAVRTADPLSATADDAIAAAPGGSEGADRAPAATGGNEGTDRADGAAAADIAETSGAPESLGRDGPAEPVPPPAAVAPGASAPEAAWTGKRKARFAISLGIGLLLIWQLIDLRLRASDAQDDLARQLAASAALQSEVRAQVRQLQDAGQALQQKVAVIEARVGDFESQQESLQGLYQEVARGRDEWLLSEIDQLVGLATQQLQIAGNVPAAIQALANADARLARSQRPQFISLRKAIGSDLQRLRAIRTADLAGISLRLENVALMVDELGLAHESRPPPAQARSGSAGKSAADAKSGDARAGDSLWQRWWRETWAEFRPLIHVERMDRPDPVVLAPNQMFFLRENLKLRLLSARVELLTRDQATFRGEIKLALQWLEKYFDSHDKRVQGAIEALKPLLSSELSIEPPSLAESLAAIRAVKLPTERPAR